jgi:hypothetical protein
VKRRMLLGMALTLALAGLQASAFAQAAAESALLGASSATATVKAGSALGSALNQATKQLAGQVQQQTLHPALGQTSPSGTRPVSTSPVKGTAVPSGTTPAQGDMIASIQGAGSKCVPTNQTASTPGSKTESAQTNCSGLDSASQPASQKYNSVITLSLPK